MGEILQDVRTAANWVADALSQTGYRTDFSPASLWQVEYFFDDNCRDGKALKSGLLADQLGYRLFAVGSYVGEVIRREIGGEWKGDDSDPGAEINVELRLPDGTVCWPVQRAMKRFKNGPEDGIFAYGLHFGLEVGPAPERTNTRTSRPWWKFW